MTCTANRVRQLVEFLSPISLAFSQFTKERANSSSAEPNVPLSRKGSPGPASEQVELPRYLRKMCFYSNPVRKPKLVRNLSLSASQLRAARSSRPLEFHVLAAPKRSLFRRSALLMKY
jgi:hypothetical protein